ncbi:MAG: hypothetical protein PW786_09980 [Arachidicoccus sp.]|nr:hypothetical protein [Arachidicoccus sp.]
MKIGNSGFPKCVINIPGNCIGNDERERRTQKQQYPYRSAVMDERL